MTACRYVGRVGGLAVALGVGVAVIGAAEASAETTRSSSGSSAGSSSASSAGSSAGSSPSTRSANSSATSADPGPRRTVRGGRGGGASDPGDSGVTVVSAAPVPDGQSPAGISGDAPRSAAAVTAPANEPVGARAAVSIKATDTDTGTLRAAAGPVPATTGFPSAEVAEAPREPASILSAPLTPLAVIPPTTATITAGAAAPAGALADGSPALPAGSPLEWAGLALARRDLRSATVTAVPAAAAATLPLILGPSGTPLPSETYVDRVMSYYVIPNSPGGVETPQIVFTPEGLYPITGVKSLPLNTSVDQGATELSYTLSLLPDGTTTTMFGYSQSAIIGSLLQTGFQPSGSPYDPIPPGLENSVEFVFVGNEMNPNGGFLSRFPDFELASLGIPFYGATPEDAYPTVNYTLEYDGFADYPRYPLNFLSVLNAGVGLGLVHTKYASAAGQDGCRTYCLTQEQVDAAIPLPSTDPTQRYFFIPTENLPLLEPLRAIPLIGNPIADLIQPVLKVIVDLGYGDPAHGFATGTQPPANVQVPFGLFPDVSPLEVLQRLVDGVGQGVTDFIAAIGPGGSVAREISSISLPPLSLPAPGDIIPAVQNLILGVANGISSAAASLYAALLPTADLVNAIATSLPAYAINLFLDGVEQVIGGDLIGGLLNAIGRPIAAIVGLTTYAGLIAALVWVEGIAGIFGFDPNA